MRRKTAKRSRPARGGRARVQNLPRPPLRARAARLLQVGGMDIPFLCLVFILFVVGITMMYSASYVYAQNIEGDPNNYFRRQLIWGALGFAAMFIISKIDYRILNSVLAPLAFFGTVLLLLATYAINAYQHNKVKRWIYIGSHQFQPSELAKFVLVLTMAYLISVLYRAIPGDRHKRTAPRVSRLRAPERVFLNFFDSNIKCTILLAAVVSVFCVLILLESHLSCTILMFLMGVSMMWVGGVKKKWFVVLGVVVAVAVVVVYLKPDILDKISGFGYDRVMVWKTKLPSGDADNWQTEQSLLAIGSGGPFGVGFGNSKQKYLYIPEPQNDFIFAVVVEELGFVGGTLIVLLFAALVCRGFMIATKTRDLFGALLVIGIVMQVALQVILNIAVVTDTIPNTGIGLPFFSYGGTALFFMLCEMGVVLSVSRRIHLRPILREEEEAA